MRKMIWIQQQPLIKVYFFYWWPPASQLKETEVKLNLQNATLQQYNSLLEWSSWGGKPHTLNFFLSMHFGFKKCTFLSVNVFSTKVWRYFYVSYWRRGHHFMWSFKPCEGLADCMQGKGSTLTSQLFQRVLVRPLESNPWPPALQSSTLQNELITCILLQLV